MVLRAIGDRFRASFRRWAGRGQAQSTARPQSNEAELLEGLLSNLRVPKVLCEFGFDAREFNRAGAGRGRAPCLLIDSDAAKVAEARRAFRLAARDITVRCLLLDRKNVQPAIASCSAPSELSVLSVDVGRKRLLAAPGAIRVSPRSNRVSGLTTLAAAHAYDLVAVSEAGLNAVFRRHDRDPRRSRSMSRRPTGNAFRNKWHRLTAQEQWDRVSHLPLVWT